VPTMGSDTSLLTVMSILTIVSRIGVQGKGEAGMGYGGDPA
jgi:hypothetical protein